MERARGARLHKNVYLAGVVSLLNDASSEMIYPILPLFLTGVLHAGKGMLGLIEGAAECTASLLKVASGIWSDRYRDRKKPMFAGYGLSLLSRPLIAVAGAPGAVLLARLIDRTGKGIRTAPRDAVIADCTDLSVRGRAYGLHRAMDTVGATVGPACAMLLLGPLGWDMRKVFWFSIIPGIIALLFIHFIKDVPPPPDLERRRLALSKAWDFGPRYRSFLLVTALFTLGNSSDTFLLLKAREAGFSVVKVTGVYLLFNLVYAAISQPIGALSDRLGRGKVTGISFFYYSAIYFGFAFAASPYQVAGLFLLYGGFQAVEEGVKKAFLSEMIPKGSMASGMGLYNAVKGVALLPASLLTGMFWDRFGSGVALGASAAIALAAGLLFIFSQPAVGEAEKK